MTDWIKHKRKGGITMETLILIAVCCLIYALILFVIAYASDTVDIAYDDFKYYEPSINDLSEEERTSICTINNYVKNTICPRYHYQMLRSEIVHHQEDAFSSTLVNLLFINAMFSYILLKILSIEKWLLLLLGFVVLIMGFVCYFVVKQIYKKYSSECIISYYKFHSSYDWHSHYNHLLLNKDKVIFRHTLRNIISVLSFLLFIVAAVYHNIN